MHKLQLWSSRSTFPLAVITYTVVKPSLHTQKLRADKMHSLQALVFLRSKCKRNLSAHVLDDL